MTDNIVQVKNLSHSYSGTQWAIKDINFEIPKCGIMGLLGSNGAGKSTTMNIICGAINQTQGDVFINGVNLRIDPQQAKQWLGFLPQKPPLYPDMTVEEYLKFCGILRSIPKSDINRLVTQSMEKCGIAHFKKRLIRNLSGGYQQRVGIAQAIIHNPLLVVFDEPTNGLDPNQITEVRKLIREIAKEHAVLISTHILSEVQALCQSIRMIENGRMVFSGTLRDFDNVILPTSFIVQFDNAPIADELEKMDSITDVEAIGNQKFRIHYNGNIDVLKKFVAISVKNNWELIEIKADKSSLDEVFAKLSNKNKNII